MPLVNGSAADFAPASMLMVILMVAVVALTLLLRSDASRERTSPHGMVVSQELNR